MFDNSYTEEGHVRKNASHQQNSTPPATVAMIRRGDARGLEALHRGGVDITTSSENSIRPLCAALMALQPECARVLLDAGAGVSFTGAGAFTPLHTLCLFNVHFSGLEYRDDWEHAHRRWVSCVRELMLARADFDALDHAGNAPLHRLFQKTKAGDLVPTLLYAQADCLLEHGASPDLRDCNGMTPLLHAVDMSLPSVVELLLEHGASPSVASSRGVTPMQWNDHNARESRRPDDCARIGRALALALAAERQ